MTGYECTKGHVFNRKGNKAHVLCSCGANAWSIYKVVKKLEKKGEWIKTQEV